MIVANTFQTFNFYIDQLMELLTDSELRCLLYAVRHIMGWQDKIAKRRGCISLKMFENGFTTESGTHYAGCGLKRKAIIDATTSLVTFQILKKIGDPGPDGQEWELVVDDIQWKDLKERHQGWAERDKRRTRKAIQKQQHNTPVMSDITGSSDITPPVMSDITPPVMSDEPNQSHVQSHLQSQKITSYDVPEPSFSEEVATLEPDQPMLENPEPPATAPATPLTDDQAIVAIIKAWLDESKVIQPKAYANKTMRGEALEMHKRGIAPEQIRKFVAERMVNKNSCWWQDVTREIVGWTEHHAQTGQADAYVPPDEPPATDEEIAELKARFEATISATSRKMPEYGQ